MVRNRILGSDDFCDSFYIAPDSEDPIYPYSNTFNVGAPINWDGSGQKDALNKYRIVGTHNSYHVMQYPGSPTYWANWWAMYVKPWRYEHPDFIKQLDSGWRNFGSASKIDSISKFISKCIITATIVI